MTRRPILLHDGRVDTVSLRVHRTGQPVCTLTPREGRLLDYLHEREGQTVPREELLVDVFGYAPGVVSRSIDTAIRRLRTKLEQDPSSPRHVMSDYGVSYRLVTVSAPTAERTEGLYIEREALARAVDEAAEAYSVITLWGPGGIGKTTALGRHVAGRSRPSLWVDLGETPASSTVAQHLSEVLGPPGASPSTLRAWLDQTGGLVALDEAEGRLDEVREFVRAVLDAHDGPLAGTVAITSRQRLDLAEEWAVVVPPMSTAQGAELYRQRASQLGVDVEVDASLGELVAALDGLPLGIRLAASRVLLQSPEDQLTALRAGQGAGDPSQRLHDTVATSWHLLPSRAVALLSRLSLFQAGFRTEDVTGIAGHDALDALAQLVDASMVHRQERLLRRAAEDPEPLSVRQRASLMSRLGFLEAYSQWSVAGTELTRQAIALAESLDDPHLSSRLMLDHARALWRNDRYDEALRWCERAVEAVDDLTDDLGRIRRGTALGHLGVEVALSDPARMEEGIRSIVEGMHLVRSRAPRVAISLQNHLARLYVQQGRFDAATATLEDMARRATAIGDLRQADAAWSNAGICMMEKGRYAEASYLILERGQASTAPFVDMARDALEGSTERTRAAADAHQAGEVWGNAVVAMIGRLWLRARLPDHPAAHTQSSTGR